MSDERLVDDFKNNSGYPTFTDVTTSTVAEQKGKEGNNTNVMHVRTVGLGLASQTYQDLMQSVNNFSYRYSGAGSFDNQYQLLFTGFEKYGKNLINPNTELSGFTFITRPKLNLSPGATSSDPILGLLQSVVPESPMFAIRCMLDTKFCEEYSSTASLSNLIDIKSPFFKLLTNCSRSSSGWPDMNIDTHTTEGGYFSEDQTTFLGYDYLNRTYDLNLEFTDIQGGHVMALFYYWIYYMAQLKRGRINAYAEDIDARRLCYTCSIYRFIMDPSKQVITKWSKATGCFPKSLPIGACFNINSSEVHVSSSQKFSVPFVVNKIEYNDPRILGDFNTVTRRFWSEIVNQELMAPINKPEYNFVGRPYVKSYNGAYRLVWLYDKADEPYDNIRRMLDTAKSELLSGITAVTE